MTTTTAARRSETEPEAPKPRKVRPLDPAMIWKNRDGQVFREWFCRLPPDFDVAADLLTPSIWSRIQTSRDKALMKLDRVMLITADESHMYVAYVTEATGSEASLSKPQQIEMKSRLPIQFSTPDYRMEWRQGAVVIIRRKDEAVMPGSYSSEAFAIAAINRMTPVKA